jgi:hypothetical protein
VEQHSFTNHQFININRRKQWNCVRNVEQQIKQSHHHFFLWELQSCRLPTNFCHSVYLSVCPSLVLFTNLHAWNSLRTSSQIFMQFDSDKFYKKLLSLQCLFRSYFISRSTFLHIAFNINFREKCLEQIILQKTVGHTSSIAFENVINIIVAIPIFRSVFHLNCSYSQIMVLIRVLLDFNGSVLSQI